VGQATSVAQSVSNLWAWLGTWEDDTGGIHGPVVYHHRDNLKVLRPDTWTQSATILGLLNAYEVSNDDAMLTAASRLGGFLARNYISDVHVYRDSNFDQKPLGRPALEGNALASLSLLRLGRALGPNGDSFLRVANDNMREFVVRQWDSQVKSFAVRYHGRQAHIHNKGAIAILAILASEQGETDGEMTRTFAVPSAEFMMACQVQRGEFAGAFPYADKDSEYRTIYSLVTALGLLALHRVTGNEKYVQSVERLLDHLSSYLDSRTGLICHYHKVGYPQWVTDTILYHLVRKTVNDQRHSDRFEPESSSFTKLLSYQYPSGAFPLSLGFEDLWYRDVMRSRPELQRWRDVLPTPGMNSWNFWFLSAFLERGQPLPPPSISMPHTMSSSREETEGPCQITDGTKELLVVSVPDKSIRLLIRKDDDVPAICDLKERTSYWKTVDSIMRYPEPIRRIILAAPRFFLKLRH